MKSLHGGPRTKVAIAVTGLATIAGALSTGPATAATPRLTLCPPLPVALCGILGGGGGGGGTPTLPTGVTTADPTSYLDTATSQSVTLTDPLASIYSTVTQGATVELVGSGSTAGQTVPGVVGTISGTSIPVTFDLNSGIAPLAPGAYSIVTTPAVLTADLSTLLGGLGLGALPIDTVAVSVTAAAPTPLAAVSVKPGESARAEVTSTSAPFAAGDTVSVTNSTGAAVAGVSVTGTTVSANALSATVAASSSVPLGRYNLVVTDTSGQSGACTGCVTVTNSAATRLTMTSTHSHLVSGAETTLSGTLSTTAGKALGSRSIALLLKNAGAAKGGLLKVVTTSASGRFSYAFAPKRNAVYVAYFNGDASSSATDSAAVSAVKPVTVARAVTLHVTVAHASSKQAKHPLTATGKVSPAGAGRRVTLYDGTRKIGSAKVTKKGTYRITGKSLGAGKHALRAKVAAQTAYQAGASKVVHKTVK